MVDKAVHVTPKDQVLPAGRRFLAARDSHCGGDQLTVVFVGMVCSSVPIFQFPLYSACQLMIAREICLEKLPYSFREAC